MVRLGVEFLDEGFDDLEEEDELEDVLELAEEDELEDDLELEEEDELEREEEDELEREVDLERKEDDLATEHAGDRGGDLAGIDSVNESEEM